MRVLEEFINEYKSYCQKEPVTFDDTLTGTIQEVKTKLLDKKFLPSKELKDILDKLIIRSKKPMKVAIAGQFSSGKTTFINALLSKNILPTGITPVTSKVNFIEYGTHFKLKVTYNSGATEYHAIENISLFTDQRKSTVDIKFLTLFAPLEILKEIIFVDTPGLNSQSQSDTQITQKVLKDVDGIIWLTLLDNAGKQSEQSVLKNYMKNFKDKSICVLNQKDKFTNTQVNSTTNYIEDVFGEFFTQVTPISAKQALDANINLDTKLLEESNINQVLEFINNSIRPKANEMKNFRIKNDLKSICDILIKEYETIIDIYHSLYKILDGMNDDILSRLDNIYKIYENELIALENYLEAILEKIANETYKNIRKTTKQRYETKKKLLGEKIEKYEYEIYTLDADHTIDKLFYSDDGVEKMFKSCITMIENIKKDTALSLENIFEIISCDILKWKDTYELTKRQRYISSHKEFSTLRHFAAKIYESVLVSFQNNILENTKELSNKLEFLRGALYFGYKQNSIATINHFEKQIKESIELYEKDPSKFILNPIKEDEILTQLKANFSFEQFQNNLSAKHNYLYVLIEEAKKNYQNTNKNKMKLLEQIKDEYRKKSDDIKEIKEKV